MIDADDGDLDDELERLLRVDEITRKFVNTIQQQLFAEATELFGDHALVFVTDSLRTVANMLEREGRLPDPDW